jgi:hypothetical protein
MSPRRHMPLSVKLDSALHALGLLGMEIQWDHSPPLAMRPVDPVTGDTIPPANDPRYISPMIKDLHRVKTNGNAATCADGDIHKIAKARRISKKHEEFQRRILEPTPREDRPESKWPSRKFPRKVKSIGKER